MKNCFQLYTLFFCVSFFISFSHSAQQIKRLNSEEGLSNGTINVFEKDSLGYMWIGTNKGVNRYSGIEFKSYKLNKLISAKSNNFSDIINVNGELYLLNSGGSLLKYLYDFDSFEEVLYLENKVFLSIAKLNDEELLIGLSNGFIIFNIKSQETSTIQHPNTFINRRIIVKNNIVYAGTARGVYIYSYSRKEKKLNFKKRILEKNDVIDIALDTKNQLWIGTEVDGLFISNGEITQNIPLKQDQKKTYAIRKIEFDKQNNALVAIDRLGFFVLDSNFNIVKSFSHDIDNANTISQNSIYQIFVDDTNAYWLGLREGGINIIYQKDNVFKHINHILNNNNSINNNNIRAIFETESGDLWFGTENGVSKYSNNQWFNYNQNSKLYNSAVLAINSYQNNLLLGTYGEGLLQINSKNGNVEELNLTSDKPQNFIFHIAVFNDDLWISRSDGPLSHYQNNKFISNYSIGLVKSIVEGYDDINYAGSDSGFYQINKRNKSVRRIGSGIFNNLNEIKNLNFDQLNNCIWIACTEGLYKFSLETENIENISLITDNETETVFSIEKDNMQNLYLAAISGLWRYDIKNNLFRKFDSQDGIQINEFGPGASHKLKDGSLAFGGPKGAVLFNPLELEKDQEISKIYISNFQINGKEPDSLQLPKNINYTNDLILNSDQNSISFNFETIKFHGSKRNHFQWKLEGYDKEYQDVFGKTKITYSNLKPGAYVLHAIGYNADGAIGNDKYLLNIKILKPFWKTHAAIAFYLLLFCFIIYLIYRITRANYRKRVDEDRIKFFVEVAHDIRTPVSLIQLLVKQLSNQENTKKSIELIQRNTENLNEYVTQLLDFQKIDRNQLKLSITKVDLKDCITEIVNDFTPILQEKSLDLSVNVKHIPVWFDKVKMSRIFYNLISNAIKYSNEGGEININAFLDDTFLRIEFQDNGIGIPENQQELVFQRFTRGTNVSNKGIPGTGIGLMLSKKIVELHGGKISLESKENVGSKFIIKLPSGTEHYKDEELVNETKLIDKTTKVDDLLFKDKLVLLIEDTEELRAAIKLELEKNYTVIDAANGKEGLLLALSKNPDIIITDIMMPEMNGRELCNLLKTNFKTSHIPIVMLTALVDIDDKLQGLETGADAYVEKPFNIEILKATINNLIKSRENLTGLLEDKKTNKQLSPDERFLSDVIETIKENLTSNDFSIDTLCEKMGLSRSNLFRKLKGLIQMSPSDLIIKIKLSKAEELMKNKNFSRISDIAYESGFQDPKYFSTLFKKHYGKTPKEFIEEN